MGVFTGPVHGPSRGGVPGHTPMGGNRGGAVGGRGGISGGGARGGRAGSMSGNRGGLGGRGRGGSFVGGGGGGGRGGGQPNGPLRGHGSRGNFGANRDYGGRRGGGSFNNGSGGGSFRARNQGGNRGGRHDGGSSGSAFNSRDGTALSNVTNGKKEENRRTLTDFKMVGLSIPDLDWTWGVLPPSPQVKIEMKETVKVGLEESNVVVKDEEMEDDSILQGADSSKSAAEPQVDSKAEAPLDPMHDVMVQDTPTQGSQAITTALPRVSSDVNSNTPPPSRIRIYFHTPVTADDARPIPNSSSFSYTDAPSDTRKGKRKKIEDDDADGDLDDSRAPPPPPQMAGLNDDRSSVAASVAPSVAETASEADWLMAAIVEGEEEDEAAGELHPPDDEEEDSDHMHAPAINKLSRNDDIKGEMIDGIIHNDDVNLAEAVALEPRPAVSEETDRSLPRDEVSAVSVAPVVSSSGVVLERVSVDGPINGVDAPLATDSELERTEGFALPSPDGHVLTAPSASEEPPVSIAADAISSSQNDSLLSESVEEQPTNHLVSVPTQILDNSSITPAKSLSALSADATLLSIETQNVETQETSLVDNGPSIVVNGHDDDSSASKTHSVEIDSIHADHLPEPPASPTSNTLLSTSSTSTFEDSLPFPVVKAEVNSAKIPSANRLSLSYAGGNRRLVIDAEVVKSLKVFRQEGRIEVVIEIGKEGDDGLKGIVLEGLSDVTKSYLPLPTLLDSSVDGDPDITLPPFSRATLPSTLTLLVHLDTTRPLSEPKWAKTGDIQDWLKSMFGRMFWVSGDAAEGWEKKIQVVDPDPAPTIWTVLDGWATNSPVGALNERQRFLKTHLTETDNVLEILLRLVRGERATPFSQTAPTISGPSICGPLLSALSPGSAHGAQQTHVSLAVLAMFRMTVEYAKKALGAKGKGEVEERVGEIIRCLPSHLIYKSLDGIFKEWRVEKKGR